MGGTLPPSLSPHRHHVRSGPNLHTSVTREGAENAGTCGVAASMQSKSALKIEEERRAERQSLIWRGVLHHENQNSEVRVRNISATGAMIQSPAPFRVGTQLLLKLSETISIQATVEWTSGEHLGVSFQDSFDLTLLVQARPIATQSTWAPPSYLNSAIQAAWERRLRRLSPAQLQQELKEYFGA
jgi:hypothetical protein